MIPRRILICKNRTNLLKNFTAKPWPLKSLAHSASCGVGESACQKSLAEFAARRRQRNKIIFSRDMCVRENTARAASVEFVRHRRTNYARSRPQTFCRKNPEGFSTVSLAHSAACGVGEFDTLGLIYPIFFVLYFSEIPWPASARPGQRRPSPPQYPRPGA